MKYSLGKIYFINIIFLIIVVMIVFIAGYLIVINDISLKALAQDEDDDTPPIISDIKILETFATSSVITWKTDEFADSLVNYGLDTNYGIARDPRADKIEHKIILDSLLYNTKYFFRITSADSEGNQGISRDYSFVTEKDKEIIEEGYLQEKQEEIIEEASEEQIEQILEVIKNTSSEEILEQIQEEVINKAEEILTPPTIILDYANIEVGTDWAIISWETDKESNTIVALAEEDDYNEEYENTYVWKEGEPDEMVLDHSVEINGLNPSTIYHFQVSSKSELDLTGRSYDKTFKTKSVKPEITGLYLSKIEEESATLRWQTNVPCSAIAEYTNLNNKEAKLEGNSSFVAIHSMKLSNLIFDTYYSVVVKVESENKEKSESDPIAFITTRDKYPPAISNVKTESTLYPGSENKIQTIASWKTDEPGKCQLFYHQGLISIDEPSYLLIEEDYSVKHVEVIVNFLPASVYKYWIVCEDEAGNKIKSEDFTMLTPTQEESIIDIIIKNFESQFSWLKKK